MRSSDLAFGAALAAGLACASPARAQATPQGFAVERFYPSAPGGGWFVMDALDMHGGLGAVVGVTTGYARGPLRVSTADGSQRLRLVSEEAFASIDLAVTYKRFRLYLNLPNPALIKGDCGAGGACAQIGGYTFQTPQVDAGQSPDLIADPRIGVDVRLVGEPAGPFRLGAGAQLIPSIGSRGDYDTDGTPRAMFRALFAGDVGALSYAGHVGVHVRPLDDSPAPGSPQGSELLFGVAAGPRFSLGPRVPWAVVVGPEVFGASAFKSFGTSTGTALEALVGARLEGTRDRGRQLRLKLGAGGGLDPRFGAPEWRVVFGLEVFDHDERYRPPTTVDPPIAPAPPLPPPIAPASSP